MTLEQAKSLQFGQIIHHREFKNADKTPARYKVNGKVKTWKRSLDKVKVPLKRGLYEFGYLTESNLDEFELS
jgi:hypothetical protein